ncbi:MAG: transglycosylase SLT domain-containing protein [Xanthobacteraceae bacterium]
MVASPISSAGAALSHITGAIRQAAQAVGTSFSYLLTTARVESNFNPNAKAKTSSAQGLFQFIEQTWLATVKDAGPRFGYGQYTDSIVRTRSGRMEVASPALRAEILNLRRDPAANAAMAGAFTRSNADYLTRRLGRAPSEGELYIAHFLGAGGATKLIGAAQNSNGNAAALFPAAAKANRSIFFDKQGHARSAGEVYADLTGRYAAARARTGTVLAAETAPPHVAAPPPNSAVLAQAFAAEDVPAARREVSAPVFDVLFHTGERHQAVAPRISQLWDAPSTSQSAPGKPLDLFQELRAEVRSLFTGRG